MNRTNNHTDGDQLNLLLSLKLCALRNKLCQAVVRSPLKSAITTAAVAVIWLGMYVLFNWIFSVAGKDGLAGPVAIRYVLDFFFLALTVMLMLSTGLLSYTGLFTDREVGYLLTTPLRCRAIVVVKYLESLILASWSLILLGLPLMAAYGSARNQGVAFAAMSVAFFLAFVAIPGSWGMMLAALLARYTTGPARKKVIYYILVPAAALGLWWLIQTYSAFQGDYQKWLDNMYQNIRFIRGQLWPSTWMAKGISSAANGDWSQASFYLLVVFSNALFFSLLAVQFTGIVLPATYARVHGARSVRHTCIFESRPARIMQRLAGPQCGAMMLKDLTCFIRDPLQWGQLAIVLGLLTLYMANAPNLPLELDSPRWQHLMSFLNLTAVSLLMASFTSRFVYPLISLELRTSWLISVLPTGRAKLVWWKFIFAFMITGTCAVAIMSITAGQTDLPAIWTAVSVSLALAISAGLSAIAVGFGARFAHRANRYSSMAHIASNAGGTFSLIAAVLYIAGMLVVAGLLSLHALALGSALGPVWALPAWLWMLWPAALVATLAVVAIVLTWGIRHFQNAQL